MSNCTRLLFIMNKSHFIWNVFDSNEQFLKAVRIFAGSVACIVTFFGMAVIGNRPPAFYPLISQQPNNDLGFIAAFLTITSIPHCSMWLCKSIILCTRWMEKRKNRLLLKEDKTDLYTTVVFRRSPETLEILDPSALLPGTSAENPQPEADALETDTSQPLNLSTLAPKSHRRNLWNFDESIIARQCPKTA